MPGCVEAADENPCSATAMRKATRRMTQLYDDALTQAGLRRPSTRSLTNSTGRPMLRRLWVSWPRRSCWTGQPLGTTCDHWNATVSSRW